MIVGWKTLLTPQSFLILWHLAGWRCLVSSEVCTMGLCHFGLSLWKVLHGFSGFFCREKEVFTFHRGIATLFLHWLLIEICAEMGEIVLKSGRGVFPPAVHITKLHWFMGNCFSHFTYDWPTPPPPNFHLQDILFDANTHKVKKFVLHTNYPGHYNFNMWVVRLLYITILHLGNGWPVGVYGNSQGA